MRNTAIRQRKTAAGKWTKSGNNYTCKVTQDSGLLVTYKQKDTRPTLTIEIKDMEVSYFESMTSSRNVLRGWVELLYYEDKNQKSRKFYSNGTYTQKVDSMSSIEFKLHSGEILHPAGNKQGLMSNPDHYYRAQLYYKSNFGWHAKAETNKKTGCPQRVDASMSGISKDSIVQIVYYEGCPHDYGMSTDWYEKEG